MVVVRIDVVTMPATRPTIASDATSTDRKTMEHRLAVSTTVTVAGDPASSVSTGDSVADEVDGTTGTMGAANGASGGLGTDRDVVDAREGAESIKEEDGDKEESVG